MLRGENFRWRHKRDLVAIFDDDGGSFQSDDGFAAADVAFQRRCMGKGRSRSVAISTRTRFCAAVGLKGRMRFTASRIFSSRTRMAMPRWE